MDKNKIIEIVNDVKNRSNSDLIEARNTLQSEFDNAKKIIIDLTRHIESVEEYYEKINDEIKKRVE